MTTLCVATLPMVYILVAFERERWEDSWNELEFFSLFLPFHQGMSLGHAS
jgi:hypothetical protein